MIFPPPPPPPVTSKAQPAYYRLRDVVRITALSRSTIYRRIAEGRFPAPIHLGGKASGWARGALQRWINDPAGYSEPTPPQAAAGQGIASAGAVS
ncbi:MAG: AlpA family phage regulatory protein [Polaromonas sp.]|nr:AlpA family phage regulatory protein [Polaromonas sp.]